MEYGSKWTRTSYPQLDQEMVIARMKVRIKRILKMQLNNSTLDQYLLKSFNVNSINPMYVFLVPGNEKKKVRKLVYQRSDFLEAEFPNVTSVNKFKRSLNRTYDDPIDDDYSEHEFQTFSNINDSEDESMNIVEENLRTERNFIKFMDDLNEDIERQVQKQILKQVLQSKNSFSKRPQLFTPNTQTVDWGDLGLDGWSGDLKEVYGHPLDYPVLERPTTEPPAVQNDPFDNVQASFDPQKFLKSATTTTKSVIMHPTFSSILTTSTVGNRSSPYPRKNKTPGLFLSHHVEEKLHEVLNRTKQFPGKPPRWPITNSRDAHRDEDVFIARANDPFGHSTKWRYSNESSDTSIEQIRSREGRAKRGVYNLYSMIKCATGCDPIIYKGYGCYCGFLGSGRTLDGIDKCCRMHDYCYSNANCPMFLEYFVPYLWKCYRGRPLCAVDHGEWGGPNSCAARLCHCDLSLSKCLRRYHCPRKRNVCTTSPLRLLQNLVMVF
ncbi:uncharacterized protein LOC129758142 isoform X2 [Uranotaenia lowii]|uniref:uncharacterized protein LOC129758142 isoform X2 n=1 Tax=Uranotaenia lowii TaxID=190385 RepID=UPI00247A1D61|nr:uncharacterized protein LOC129758142 isoform X2 [Uranotaenia lowii]